MKNKDQDISLNKNMITIIVKKPLQKHLVIQIMINHLLKSLLNVLKENQKKGLIFNRYIPLLIHYI